MNTKEYVNDVLVVRYLKEFGMDILELAVTCKCKKFFSEEIIQKILSYIWSGKSFKIVCNSELVYKLLL